ncbi:porin [Aquincola sp. J276]|uniref:porin n=1 Tax=Aquincola sp. J276 TaxID=2898432 RepID=UPI0021508E05|nr:porin [Aquincola sp. J276]MCR5864125.1 porin [Aquincola sp. J276]
MQYRVLALAALAALTGGTGMPAHAQSNVTIYGRFDLGVTRQNDGTSSLSGSNGRLGREGERWDVRHGSESRLGFQGVEDLGSGLRAGFQIEHRFRSDTGEADPVFWKARSYVYLESAQVGTLYLGREYVPAFWPALKTDPWLWDTVGSPGLNHQFATYRIDGHARGNNSVGYKTPKWNGFSANVAVAAGEAARDRSTGANVEYASGPLYAGLGVDRQNADTRVVVAGAAYDLGWVRPMFTYTDSRVAAKDVVNLTLGASAPLGRGILRAAIARLDPDGDDNNITKLGLGYEHLLSKRTSVYADLGSAKQQGRLAGVERTRTTAVDVGLKHSF